MKNDIRELLGTIEPAANIPDLGQNFALAQVAPQTAAGRQAEAAVLGTPDLGREAEREMVFLRDQNAFDTFPVGQFE